MKTDWRHLNFQYYAPVRLHVAESRVFNNSISFTSTTSSQARPCTPPRPWKSERRRDSRQSNFVAMESALKWEPAALNFGVALNKASMQQLRTRNTSSSNVAYTFKVKTTNPKRYSVRPNVGVVWPSKDVTVTVQLPAMKEYPSDMNKCKDKFQVLTLPLKYEMAEKLKSMSADQQRNELTDLWASSDAKDAVVDKIRCSMTFDSSFRGVPIEEEEHPIPPYSPETVPQATGEANTPAAHTPSVEEDTIQRAARAPPPPPARYATATQLTSEPELARCASVAGADVDLQRRVDELTREKREAAAAMAKLKSQLDALQLRSGGGGAGPRAAFACSPSFSSCWLPLAPASVSGSRACSRSRWYQRPNPPCRLPRREGSATSSESSALPERGGRGKKVTHAHRTAGLMHVLWRSARPWDWLALNRARAGPASGVDRARESTRGTNRLRAPQHARYPIAESAYMQYSAADEGHVDAQQSSGLSFRYMWMSLERDAHGGTATIPNGLKRIISKLVRTRRAYRERMIALLISLGFYDGRRRGQWCSLNSPARCRRGVRAARRRHPSGR